MSPAFVLTLSGLLAAPATPENPTPTLQVTPELRRWQLWTYVGGGAALSAIAFLAVR